MWVILKFINFLKMIRTDRNMSKLWYIVLKKYIILTLLLHCISTVNTKQRPDILVQLGYIWRHVSAVSIVNNTILCWPEDDR